MKKIIISPTMEGLKKAFVKFGFEAYLKQTPYISKLSVLNKSKKQIDIVFDKVVNEFAVLSEDRRYFGITSLQEVVSKSMSLLKGS